MPAVVTRKWSTYIHGDDRSVIEFEVTGVANTLEARNAVPFQKGATHERDATQTMLRHPEVTRDIEPYLVRCEFERPSNDTGATTGSGEPGDPLLEPVRIQWGRIVEAIPTDVDINGNKIRNAAGDGYSPKLTLKKRYRTVTFTRNLIAFPYALADAYEDKIASNAISITGTSISWPAQTVKCESISAAEYAMNAPFVPVSMQWIISTTGGAFPFRERVVNQGRNGWYSKSGTVTHGSITGGGGNAVTDDQLLDSSGKPILTSLKVEGQAPVANPQPVTGYFPLTTLPNGGAVPGPAIIHLWQTTDMENFDALINFFFSGL